MGRFVIGVNFADRSHTGHPSDSAWAVDIVYYDTITDNIVLSDRLRRTETSYNRWLACSH